MALFTKKYRKRVVLEGCNGDWAQKRYLPSLAEKAAKEEIELWAIDIEPQIRVSSSKLVSLWGQDRGNVHYLDKTKNEQAYRGLSDASYVFIVTPDSSHCEEAQFWLERLVRDGKIFIEKPLDVSLERAKKLRGKIGERDIVYGFSHYLARAYPFFPYLGSIGQIKKVVFHILESFGIPPERAKSLEEGMIFDLFPLVLSVTDAVLSLKSYKLEDIKVARYVDAPISGETFAWIKFHVGEVEVQSMVGKYIGTSSDKFMKIYGSEGQINLNFLTDEFFVFDSQNNFKVRENLNSKHVESFVEQILQGKKPLSVPGVLSFDTAFEILAILREAKKKVGKMPEYSQAESVNSILKRF